MDKDIIEDTINTYEETADWYFQTHDDMEPIKRFADIFIAALPGKKILDVGCGPGRESKYFSDRGLAVTGIDLSRNLLNIARTVAPRAKFLHMDMRRLDFPDGSFDGIWSMASFLHVPKNETKETLRGFQRVLRPGGILFIAVKEGEGEKVERKNHYTGGRKYFVYYTADGLQRVVKSAGFKVFKVIIDKKEATWVNVLARKI